MPKVIGKPKVRFNLFDSNATEETYIILYFAYRKGKRMKYSTARKIHPEFWDRRKQRAIVRYADAATLNAHLGDLENYCVAIFDETGGGKITPDNFRAELKNRVEDKEQTDDPDPITFLEFVEQVYNDKAKQPTAKKGSLQVDHKVLWHLKTYAKEKRRKLEFSELNERFYNDFKAWLHSPPRSLSTNYVQKIFGNIKYFIRKAENQHLHNDRSYREFNPATAPVTKIALTFEQLEHMAALELSTSPHLEKARDLFLIGAYSGQRYSDFSRLKPEHIKSHDGERVIEIVTQKTRQTVVIPLHPVLDGVLARHGYTSPKMANQKMNKYLKELGQLAGLTNEIMVNDSTGGITREVKQPMWELLSTHVARRSFATNYYKKYPHLINEIMGITGHTTERMFRAYIVSDKLEGAMTFAKGIKDK